MGYKISLGSISFGINFPKLCRPNFVTPKLQVKSIVPHEKKDKFFPLKLDTLQKHVNCCKAIVATLMLLLMNGLTTNMHPIIRTRGFTQGEKIFTQISFIFKMHLDLIQSKVVQNNLILLGLFELILGLP